MDGRFHEAERTRIQSYFVDEWGYDERFVEIGLNEIETAADDHTIRQVAEQLANLKKILIATTPPWLRKYWVF